ncbi:hypothetical protein HMPREF0424_1128 [Gardnerella vaginalis 409-05]|nr:hypothetical protein HMPREF0424_1128 [Gardnerella vaginalis 409-05]EFH71900.1 hypothetical protein GV51_0727 [Gardnerella vaginalis 5-1]
MYESNSERELAWKVQWTFSMQAQKRALIVRASRRFLTTFAVIVPGVC